MAKQNALTHGLLSSCIVVDWWNLEDPENFRVLREAVSKDLQPEGALENLYVEKIAVGFWRLQRMWAFEGHRIVRTLNDEGIKEFGARERAADERRMQDYLMQKELASHYRAKVETLRAAIARLESGLSGDAVPGDAVSAAKQELERAPSMGPLIRILSANGDRVDSPEEEGAEARAHVEFEHLLTSVARDLSQGAIRDEEVAPLLKAIYQQMHEKLQVCEGTLQVTVKTVDLLEGAIKNGARSPFAEEERTSFLQRYLGPPLDGLDVYVRYETSVERRLQKDIGTLFNLQAIRLGPTRKLLGPGAIQS